MVQNHPLMVQQTREFFIFFYRIGADEIYISVTKTTDSSMPKRREDYIVLSIAFCVILLSLFLNSFKTLFVDESGTFKILGLPGIVLAVGLLRRWKSANIILGYYLLAVALLLLVFTTSAGGGSLFVICIVLITLAVFLLKSKAIKVYISRTN